MPITPPRTLQTLLTGDSATSRALQNVKNAVDPLLGLVASTFQVANDGSLSFLRRIKTFTADSVTGTVGRFTTFNATTVNAATSTATSQVSAGGFKADRDMGTVWVSGAVAATRYQAKRFTQNNEANNTYNALTLFQPSFPGSVVAVHGYSQGTAGGTFQVQLYKSAQVVPASTTPFLQTSAASAAQYSGTGQVFAKGTYPFLAGDYFCAGATFSTAGNQFVQVTLTVEYGA